MDTKYMKKAEMLDDFRDKLADYEEKKNTEDINTRLSDMKRKLKVLAKLQGITKNLQSLPSSGKNVQPSIRNLKKPEPSQNKEEKGRPAWENDNSNSFSDSRRSSKSSNSFLTENGDHRKESNASFETLIKEHQGPKDKRITDLKKKLKTVTPDFSKTFSTVLPHQETRSKQRDGGIKIKGENISEAHLKAQREAEKEDMSISEILERKRKEFQESYKESKISRLSMSSKIRADKNYGSFNRNLGGTEEMPNKEKNQNNEQGESGRKKTTGKRTSAKSNESRETEQKLNLSFNHLNQSASSSQTNKKSMQKVPTFGDRDSDSQLSSKSKRS